jgi:flagellar motor component MotA
MRYLLGVLFMLTGFTALIRVLGEGRVITMFIDPFTLLTFIISVGAVIFMSGEFKTAIRGVNALLSRKYEISDAERERAVQLFGLLTKVIWITALVSFLIGLVLMLGQLDDPAALGPMLSVMLISFYYGAFINLVFIYPAIYMLRHRTPVNPTPAVISEKQVIDKLLQLCYKQGISPEEILQADEIELK